MKRHTLGRAPDYTLAALVTLGVNLFCLLFILWSTLGLPAVLLLALALDRGLVWLARRRRARRSR